VVAFAFCAYRLMQAIQNGSPTSIQRGVIACVVLGVCVAATALWRRR
jgi:hypothetical protein